MKGFRFNRSLAIALLAIVVGLSSLAFVALPAYADDPTPTPRFRLTDLRDRALSRTYEREQDWLVWQGIHLERANEAAARAQEILDAAKAEGKDVATLEEALAAFKAELPKAQAAHDKAASILAAHNGFDAEGNVTDPQTARGTTIDARLELRDAHLTIARAVLDLRRAVRDWRQAHRPAPAAAAGS